MVIKSKVVLIIICFMFFLMGCKQNNMENEFSLDRIYYYGIQEDVSKIVNALNSIPEDSLTSNQRELKEKYISRFLTKTEKYDFKTQDSLIINVLTIFHDYWEEVLMKKKSISESEKESALLLANYLNSFDSSSMKESEKEIKPENIPSVLHNLLIQNGYYLRNERTGNIMDLIIWSKQSIETYNINIGDTIVNVPVVFIDSTITLGWEGYATFDNFYPGGWTSHDTLYCIKKDYDVKSEKFRVSYLTHETQHLLDEKLYTGYTRWMAEYRAKLAELSVAEKTVYDLVNTFIKGSKNDSRLTHPFAEYRLIEDLSNEIFNEKRVTNMQRWKDISYQRINNASKELLKQNSIGLKKKSTAYNREAARLPAGGQKTMLVSEQPYSYLF